MQIRTYFYTACVFAIIGCSQPKMSPTVTVDSAKPLSPQLVMSVTNALEKSLTFLELKHRAKRPMVFIDEEENGWVQVDVGELAKDFFHRWATLKVETKTGSILKLGTDTNLEDKWLVEFQPHK